MKQIYVVTSVTYRPSVAFNDRDKAEAVRAMCCGDIEEVPLVDAEPSAIEALDAVTDAPALFGAESDSADGESASEDGGDGDGL